jgi:hypothetical protein
MQQTAQDTPGDAATTGSHSADSVASSSHDAVNLLQPIGEYHFTIVTFCFYTSKVLESPDELFGRLSSTSSSRVTFPLFFMAWLSRYLSGLIR